MYGSLKANHGVKPLGNKNTDAVIFLLMQEADAAFFIQKLQEHAPFTALEHIVSIQALEQRIEHYTNTTTCPARIISFCSPLIVPQTILERLQFNAYNFHPGPPERPGFHPTEFAIHEKAEKFGITFHQMYAKVDSGPIIDVLRFPITPEMNVETLEAECYKALLSIIVNRAAELANVSFHFEPMREDWSGIKTTRKDLERIYKYG